MPYSIFQQAKDAVSARQAAAFYGLQPNRRGYCRCPFHSGDRSPSLLAYDDPARGWFCFGCNQGGDVIRMVELLFGLRPWEALKRLNSDFHLSLPLDQPRAAAPPKPDTDRLARRAFEDWKVHTMRDLNEVCRVAHEALMHCPADQLDPAQVEAVKRSSWAAYLSDTLEGNNLEEQMDIFKKRWEVAYICQTILRNSPRMSRENSLTRSTSCNS